MKRLVPSERLARIRSALESTRARAESLRDEYARQIGGAHPRQRRGARNLVDYLALRRTDGAALEEDLAELGLAGLSRYGPDVDASIGAVLGTVRALQGEPAVDDRASPARRSGNARIRRQAGRLFGPKSGGASARIMVTLPARAADDPELVHEMVRCGMNVARINCAHDDPATWLRMIRHVRAAAHDSGRPVRVFMDLAGPKIRIGDMAPGPRVRHFEPLRDPHGRPVDAVRIRIVPDGDGDGDGGGGTGAAARDAGAGAGDASVLPVTGLPAEALRPGARLVLTDMRGRRVSLTIDGVVDGIGEARCREAFYAETGLHVEVTDENGVAIAPGRVGAIPPVESRLHLREGDILTLHEDDRPGEDPVPASAPGGPRPGHVSCAVPEVVRALRIGERVFLDDGKVAGEVVATRPGEVDVRVTRAGRDGARIKSRKGLNLPDTRLGLFGLTEKDREDLRFVVRHADGVNVSFVQHPDDVEDLLDELDRLGGGHLGLVLKIETRGAVTHLPGILLAAMEWRTVGVMIARGDLAIEVGWLELAEVVEEILMLCEAAHVPSIWATEVLDRLAKKGVPARGEVSDVVLAGRAECIMLNKGPYIADTIRGLDRVLASLEAYRDKRAARLPALTLALPDATEVGRDVGERKTRWTTSGGG